MSPQNVINEKSVLVFSALLALGFAIAGLAVGWFAGSLVIMFDGIYSLISLVLTLLSLGASWYIHSRYARPITRALLTPLVVAIKGAVIMLLVSYSLYEAVSSLVAGGRAVNPSLAVLFGIINVVGCGYGWWMIARKNQVGQSQLVEAESRQWQMDTLLSLAVTLGFLGAWLVAYSPWSDYAVYADPMMMVLMSFYFIKVPFIMVRNALKELAPVTVKWYRARSVA
ncbi:Cation efflux family protein [Salinivibrio sp. ES.052]|nr:Cation efflux family protein [Salinivibrio sp. ES.052]